MNDVSIILSEYIKHDDCIYIIQEYLEDNQDKEEDDYSSHTTFCMYTIIITVCLTILLI